MPLSPVTTINISSNLQARYPEDVRFEHGRLPGGVSYSRGQVLGLVKQAARNDVQTVTITATGGTFKLGMTGFWQTAAIAYNANAAAYQSALDAAAGAGNFVVTGTGPFVLTAANEYANRELPNIVADNAAATGGTAAVAHTTLGSPGPYFAAYDDAAGDTRNVAKAVLWQDTKTDPAGNVISEFGPRAGLLTVPVVYRGEFPCSDLIGLDANGVADLGKIIDGGTVYTDPNAIIAIGY